MKQYYDPINNRLVYIENKASALFWDMHWEKYDVTKTVQSAALNRRILLPTRRYLPTGSRILEGGCGLGQNVWSLYKHGYDVYGVDYADETVKKVNSCMPELNVSHGDLR
ncbi:MAG: methyltransferase domain-containing protein, partial [Deltaproteobacteria bacterium]|nr:methyltransferase domain-containing protein [Deltaproteobacteria bacterium]